MKRAVLLLLLAVPLAVAEPLTTAVEFSHPAQFSGAVRGEATAVSSWSGQAGATLEVEGASIVLEYKEGVTFLGNGGVVVSRFSLAESPWLESGDVGPGRGSLSTSGWWGVQASLTSTNWLGSDMIYLGNAGVGAPSQAPNDYSDREPYPYIREAAVAREASTAWFDEEVREVVLSGDFSIEVFGLDGWIERTGREDVETGFTAYESTPTNDDAATLRHARITVTDGTLTLTGPMQGMVLATDARLDVNGTSSMTLTSGDPGTGYQDTGSWYVEGHATFAELRAADDRASGRLTADAAGLSVDGTPVAAASTSVLAVTASTVGILVLAAAVLKGAPGLTALLTRLPPEKALENANRKTLYTYIVDHPGATFREVLRETDIAAGTARHHLSVLARSKMIVEHGHRSTLRFFENHGKFDGTWASVVLLREKELSQVYKWLERNPDTIQKDLLEHAESAWSWSRSTTQHRLARLIDGGLVTFHQAGRRKYYQTIPPEAAKAPDGPRASWT